MALSLYDILIYFICSFVVNASTIVSVLCDIRQWIV
jgi:ABC-type uncharacterized transport system permease subunit